MSRARPRTKIRKEKSPILRRLALCWLFVAAASCGCSSLQVIKSEGSARWSGLGVQVTLPEGTWRIQVSEKDRVATFVPEGRRGYLALFRVRVLGREREPAAPNPPDWVALKRLFAYFRDKKEISLGQMTLPGGRKVERGEYEVKTEEGATRVTAYALRRDGWIYELAAWDFDPASGAPGERFMAGLEFAE